MNHSYQLSGLTCQGCVAKVKATFEAMPEVKEAKVSLTELALETKQEIPLAQLREVLASAGNYQISSSPKVMEESEELPEKSLTTYKPLLLIVGFIAGVTALAQYPFGEFSSMLWMRHFMAGFFLVFSFFKFLNLEGFANSYRMYDIVAEKWKGWGYIYPFVELGLGVLYLTNVAPEFTNWVTIVVLGVSTIGVVKSNLNKRKIKCACLGDVFNLPMSTVTIVEDVSMVLMAVAMLVLI